VFRVVARGARRRELGVDDLLQRARQAEAAEAGRVVHPGQARVEPRVEEILLGRFPRVVVGQEGAHPFAEFFGGSQHSVLFSTVPAS